MKQHETTPSGDRPRILYLVSEDWFFWTHRLPLAKAAMAAGFDVVLAARPGERVSEIEAAGITFVPLSLCRGSGGMFSELSSVWKLARIYRRYRPRIVHHVALKNVFLGTLAARLAVVPHIVNAFTGLGYSFCTPGWKAGVLRAAVCMALRLAFLGRRQTSIFQNEEDLSELVQAHVLRPEQGVLIRGSGVDIRNFSPVPEEDGLPLVVLASRMLSYKGIAEFVHAAEKLKVGGVQARFILVGRTDLENPTAIPAAQLEEWNRQGHVEWWGHRDDMPEILGRSAIVCLPTYYGEGLPKVLLEAAACGKPIVTTDLRGCREICRDGVNGLLVPPRDSDALAATLLTLLENPELRQQFGWRGRQIVLDEFTCEQVASQTVDLYRSLLDLPAATADQILESQQSEWRNLRRAA